MRFARSFLALAVLCTAAACADGASHVTAPATPALNEAAGGGWIGSGNVTDPGESATPPSGESFAEPADVTSDGRGGGWIGSGN